jgi:RNA-directed DNA polymerase
MAKGASKSVAEMLECQEGVGEYRRAGSCHLCGSRRVLEIQAKLHRWARDDPHRRFGDLFNLVADPAFLLVAWDRVRRNKGAKTAGVMAIVPTACRRSWGLRSSPAGCGPV